MSVLLQFFSRRLTLFVLIVGAALPAHAADQHWNLISSDHFTVLTDAGSEKGHEVAARFEQMRAVFAVLLMRKQVRMSEPIEIIAIASPAQYAQLAPTKNGHPVTAPGFFLSGEDRILIVLNASYPDCWRAVEQPIAHYFLNYNYPPTQPWFDKGIAEYFSSLYFTAQKTELGIDPELPPPGQASGTQPAGSSKSLTEILSQTSWLSLPDLLETRPTSDDENGPHPTIFDAQSWILIHYLIAKDKLSEIGAYFGLVELQKIPVDQAIQQAFGMSAAQLDSAVKDYFHSLKPATALPERSKQHPLATPQSPNESPLPFSINDVSVSSKPVQPAEAQALLDEMELRIPEKRGPSTQDLEKLVSGNRSETVVAHRALAWADIQKRDTKGAFEELTSAMQLNPSDPWTRFEIAQASYHSGEQGTKVQGLANMMESLHFVIDRYPEFAEAYNMLGWAQLTGGGPNAALGTMKYAVQFAPRSELYQLRLAKAYVGAKNWDDGAAMLSRLAGSQDPQIAAAAKKDLYELPYLRKFGIPPQENLPAKESAKARQAKPQGTEQAKTDETDATSDDEDTSTPVRAPAEPKIDNRPVQFLKAKLIEVDCSGGPAAVLVIAKGPRTLKLRTADYRSLVVLGADKFSCAWKGIPVNVNYRASGKSEGDLVSIEVP
jgi:tetratricopeptide (TPR) repeat protein